MRKTKSINNNEMIIFKTEDEKVSVDVRFEDETVWLTIDSMAKLFEKSRSTINEHILNIYAEKELRSLGQIVSEYLDFAERQVEREQAMTMEDWAEHLDRKLI